MATAGDLRVLVIIDGSTVRVFVGDAAAFRRVVDARFATLDTNGDGVVSRTELRRALETFRLTETHFGVDAVTPPDELAALYNSIFEQFNLDRSGTVDLDEFRSEMRRIMLAVADGLSSAPIQMALEDDDEVLDLLGTRQVEGEAAWCRCAMKDTMCGSSERVPAEAACWWCRSVGAYSPAAPKLVLPSPRSAIAVVADAGMVEEVVGVLMSMEMKGPQFVEVFEVEGGLAKDGDAADDGDRGWSCWESSLL